MTMKEEGHWRHSAAWGTPVSRIFTLGLIVRKDPKHLGAGGCLGINKPGKDRRHVFSYKYFVHTSVLKRIPVCDLVNLENSLAMFY